MPGKEGDPGRTAADNRLFVNAVLFVLKTGIPWEDLPERYGKPKSVWKRFDRWCASGVWERVFHAIGEDDLEEELAKGTSTRPVSKPTPCPLTGRRKLLARFTPNQIATIIADAACDAEAIRNRGRQLKARVCIKPNPTRKVRKRYDRNVYKHRNQIERFFGRIKRCRRVATRYEKKAVNFAGFIWLAALITEMIRISVRPKASSLRTA